MVCATMCQRKCAQKFSGAYCLIQKGGACVPSPQTWTMLFACQATLLCQGLAGCASWRAIFMPCRAVRCEAICSTESSQCREAFQVNKWWNSNTRINRVNPFIMAYGLPLLGADRVIQGQRRRSFHSNQRQNNRLSVSQDARRTEFPGYPISCLLQPRSTAPSHPQSPSECPPRRTVSPPQK